MPSFAQTVQCPRCGKRQAKQGPNAIYACPKCNAMFDDDPNEGGDFIQDPARNAERKEDFENRNKGKRP